MKKVVLSMAALSMLFFVACQGPKKEIARLQFQNDSIAQVNTRLASDIEELLQMIDEIEANFSQITKTEAALNQAQGERLKASIAQSRKNRYARKTSKEPQLQHCQLEENR